MLGAIIVILSVALDQLTKQIVVSKMDYERNPINILGEFLQLFRTENDGAAFGMLDNARWVFMLVSLVAIGVGVYCLVKFYRRHILLTVSVSMLLGGGIGNMIDRLFRAGVEHERAVVDFIKVPWFNFNVADAFISVGAALLFVYVLFYETKVEKALAEQNKEQSEADEAE